MGRGVFPEKKMGEKMAKDERYLALYRPSRSIFLGRVAGPHSYLLSKEYSAPETKKIKEVVDIDAVWRQFPSLKEAAAWQVRRIEKMGNISEEEVVILVFFKNLEKEMDQCL